MQCRAEKPLYVGLSNYDGKTLSQAVDFAGNALSFVINQNRYSIFDRTGEKWTKKDTEF